MLNCRAVSLNTSTDSKVSETDCAVTSNGQPVSDYSVTINDVAIKKGNSENGVELLSVPNKSNFFKLRFYDTFYYNSKSYYASSNGNKTEVVANVSVTKTNYQNSQDVIFVTGNILSEENKTLNLECPTSAKSYERFKCTTSQVGVKITVGGAGALNGTTSSFTTKSSDKTKSIEYNNNLFNGKVVESKYILNDSKGTYVNAKITASKAGYKSVVKTVKIYKAAEPTNNNGGGTTKDKGKNDVVEPTTEKKVITLTCPSSAQVDEGSKCTTNLDGV